jgi:DNA modification methylase
MNITTTKLTDIKSNPNNPRIIKDDKFKKLVASIKEFPQMLSLRPIVINDDMIVLGGNMRLKACKEAGLKEVPVIKASDLNEEQQKAFIIKDNVGYGEWDWDMLANEWDAEELVEWGLDIPNFVIDDLGTAEEDDFDVPDGGIETDIVLGDLFEIGEHRLLCGDSTDSDAVAKLMDGKIADMVFTDPPYGVSYQSNMRTKSDKFEVLKNDDVFITEWINNLPLFSNGFVFVWTSWKVLKDWIEICSQIGELSNLIVWDKGGGGIGDLKKTFLTDFEIALVYHRGAEIKGKRLGSVWSIGKDGANKYLHPTQKPVGLAAMAIENILPINKICLDFFLGSGSTMVASHQLNRKCYGMELDPKYCQVIVDRMIKLDPTLTIKRNGEIWQTNKI